MAASIKQATGVEPELIVGGRGEFTVWVGDGQVAKKDQPDDEIVEAVRRANQA